MTLPTTNNLSSTSDDESDIFGEPRSSIRRNRPKISMISTQLRLREVRKRILHLSMHKLEQIKDSERNLRRSVCINNTYSKLTHEIRREKQNKLNGIHNPPKSEAPNSSRKASYEEHCDIENYSNNRQAREATRINERAEKRLKRSCASDDSDLESLDRELCALDNPLVDPEITQGAEQLEQALQISRKRKQNEEFMSQSKMLMNEEENDRLVREALSQFYLPATRLLSEIDDCPFLPSPEKRLKTDYSQTTKELDVVIDSLRLGTNHSYSSNSSSHEHYSNYNDTCSQAAMLDASGVFSFEIASLET